MDLRAAATAGVAVRTTMPSAAGSVHEAISLGIFSTSTRHIRQAACKLSPGLVDVAAQTSLAQLDAKVNQLTASQVIEGDTSTSKSTCEAVTCGVTAAGHALLAGNLNQVDNLEGGQVTSGQGDTR